ncbi:unnamed protein product [Ostreobium quekettii]|uniref:SGNH hydrolase-type esterase domain-containing protein n=1 Tax=Ostreobium quekettii TaxID=121088 RepID=A0A8S1J0E8_9CHLO|nr:unnamed protein product [Ostreobium quekettii]
MTPRYLPGRSTIGEAHRGARQHVPLEEYKKNLERMVNRVKAAGCGNTLLITPPPVCNESRMKFLHKNCPSSANNSAADRSLEVSGQYADACVTVSKELGVPSLNLWSSFQTQPAWNAELLQDGLHFSPSGSGFLFSRLIAAIDQEFPCMRVGALQLDFPLHGDINPNSPQESIDDHLGRYYTGRREAPE